MSFHPDNHLPNCMMPDGGDCCAGHHAICEDWHKQRSRIEALEAALTAIATMDVFTRPNEKLPHEVMRDLAHAALDRRTQ